MGTGSDKDEMRNEYVRGITKIAKLGDKLQNAKLRWYGHVKRREEIYVGKRMMEMAVPDRRKRVRPRRRWMDLAREDMEGLELGKDTKSIGSNGEYFCAVATRIPRSRKKEKKKFSNSIKDIKFSFKNHL